MVFTLKENEAEARERLRAFWAGESLGRPALYVIADREGYEGIPVATSESRSRVHDLDPDWHANQAEAKLASTLLLAEAMPGVLLDWGSVLVTVAVLAGGEYDYESHSAWIKPLPDIWERPLPSFDPDSIQTGAIERSLRRMAAIVRDRGFVNPPIMLDGMTTLSGFRTPRQLCLDLMERPERVRAWSDALTSVYIDAYDHFYRLV
jgi:hypothetical protein